MLKRVDSEQYYVTFEMFVADVKRMFANARTYNSPETIYYKCATRHSALIPYSYLSPSFFNQNLVILTMIDFIVQVGKPFSKQSSIRSPIWSQKSAVTNSLYVVSILPFIVTFSKYMSAFCMVKADFLLFGDIVFIVRVLKK
jgi:hypothetical protein